MNITLPTKAASHRGPARPGRQGSKAEFFPLKHALAFTALLLLLPGCAPTNSSGPVFTDVPGVPSSSPPPPSQAPPPNAEPATPVPQPVVSRTPFYIFASGEFKHPGRLVWTNGMTLQDGIQAAGGFTDFARHRLFLYHADGMAERIRLGPDWAATNNPALRPGDKLVNPKD